jgi:hypothetical protein
VLQNDGNIPSDVVPFDAASDRDMDEQKWVVYICYIYTFCLLWKIRVISEIFIQVATWSDKVAILVIVFLSNLYLHERTTTWNLVWRVFWLFCWLKRKLNDCLKQ